MHGPSRQWCPGKHHHLRYVNEHSLQVGPITDLMGSKVACMGLGNAYTRPLGYVVIQVQVDGVWGYDEDQIALVIPDFSNFATRVPVILGMPTIGWVVNVMREAEMDALATPWANARVAHLLAVCIEWCQWKWVMTRKKSLIQMTAIHWCIPRKQKL